MTQGKVLIFLGIVALAIIVFIFLVSNRDIAVSGDIRDASRISTKSDLSRLLGDVDFTNLEIIDIRVIQGIVYVFCEGPGDAIQFCIEDEFPSPYFVENILGRVYLSEDSILNFAIAEGLYRSRRDDSLREIFWFQLDGNCSNLGNILLVTDLPHPSVRVDVHSIMSEE